MRREEKRVGTKARKSVDLFSCMSFCFLSLSSKKSKKSEKVGKSRKKGGTRTREARGRKQTPTRPNKPKTGTHSAIWPFQMPSCRMAACCGLLRSCHSFFSYLVYSVVLVVRPCFFEGKYWNTVYTSATCQARQYHVEWHQKSAPTRSTSTNSHSDLYTVEENYCWPAIYQLF